MANTTLLKVQDAVDKGILLPQDYQNAVDSTGNDPEVVSYLNALERKNARVGRGGRANAAKEKRQSQQEEKKTKEAGFGKQTLSLKDIMSSENLRGLGAQSGDRITADGELERVWSQKNDDVNLGYRLTERDILSSPNLQGLDAEVGDRLVDDELKRAKYDKTWTQFKYGYDEEQGVIADIGVWLDTHFPVGELADPSFDDDGKYNALPYMTPDEQYGEGFMDASYDTRREMIISRKERALQTDYGVYFEPNEQSGARFAGQLTGQLADPTTAIPFAGGWKTAALTGSALAGSATAADQWATTGEVDPASVAVSATIGAVLPAGMVKVGDKLATRSANKFLDKAQAKLDEHMALGGDLKNLSETLKGKGINPAAVEQATAKTGRKIKIPLNQTQGERAIQQAISQDSAVSRLYSKGIDKYLGILSTRLGNISEAIKYRVRKFEYFSHIRTAEYSNKAEPFLLGLKALTPKVSQQVSKHLYNGNLKAAEGLMRSADPKLATEFADVIRPMLDELGDALQGAGHGFAKIDDYFPRLVKDVDKLRASLGLKEQGILQKQLAAYAKKKKTKVANLSNEERSQVIELALRGYRQTTDGAKFKFAKQRVVSTVDDRMLEHYARPEESLSMYIRSAVNDIERRKFFGRQAKVDKDHATMDDMGRIDQDQSIGSLVDDAIKSGEIDVAREQELKDLLTARFIGGENSPSAAMSNLRDLGYMGTIANPMTAMIQLSDVAVASALKGFRNSIASLFGTKHIKIVDLGIEDLVTQELASGKTRVLARALNKMMGAVGFKRIDRLGKETFINTSFRRATNMVKNPKGEAKLRKEVQKIFGDETDSFIADLKAGDITENVKLYAFNELAEVQPIALSEMPEAYLLAKNGRLLYMLKSFTLKQIDVVRKNVVHEWKKGNKVQASKNATLLAGYMTVSNVGIDSVRDVLKGRDVKPEDLPDKALWSLLGIYGMNEYTYGKYFSQGKIVEGVVSYVIPATPIVDAAFTLGFEIPKDDPNWEKGFKLVPSIGDLLYQWFGGGAEKYNERQEKKRKEKRREARSY